MAAWVSWTVAVARAMRAGLGFVRDINHMRVTGLV